MFKFCPYCGYKVKEQSIQGFQCLNCKKWTHYVSNPTVTVVAKAGDEGLVAIRGREPGKGKMDLVGGFLNYGEDPIEGIVREFKEETGIDIDPKRLEFLGMWVDAYHYQDQNQLILNIVYLIELPEKFTGKPADDVVGLIWMPLSDNPDFAFPFLYEVWQKIRN